MIEKLDAMTVNSLERYAVIRRSGERLWIDESTISWSAQEALQLAVETNKKLHAWSSDNTIVDAVKILIGVA